LKTPYSDKYVNREIYRQVAASGLGCWRTQYKETELFICADSMQQEASYRAVVDLRTQLEAYIERHPEFAVSLVPIDAMKDAPEIARHMCRAAAAAGVGPMAAVAGAFAAHVGQMLLQSARQVIVENGGDVFIRTNDVRTAAVYAGDSPLSMKLGISVDASEKPVAVCTSSWRVGPSKSFGQADAAVVLSHDAYLADACATRLGNDIKQPDDLQRALDTIAAVEGVIGAVAVIGELCGAVGNITLVSL
jgi:ApbE superfamily uncharacterized protein (UPF0280 family)